MLFACVLPPMIWTIDCPESPRGTVNGRNPRGASSSLTCLGVSQSCPQALGDDSPRPATGRSSDGMYLDEMMALDRQIRTHGSNAVQSSLFGSQSFEDWSAPSDFFVVLSWRASISG